MAGCSAETLGTDQRDWSLPAHRLGTLGGMDAAKELTRTYLQRVPRGWAGNDPAARSQISHPAIDRCEVVSLDALSLSLGLTTNAASSGCPAAR
ncbi:hypothetical protein XbrCFBP1976_01670 [Xanthomonas bromi]|uniref:Uncharacterized protein n=1 Tax=Xanthomonas bromi TaxID=56449 RepID=A0ABX5BUU2_9XANT|nr:hypothetical protein XbrCFBP1976_01670 [Xanthomonas bromi]